MRTKQIEHVVYYFSFFFFSWIIKPEFGKKKKKN